jgi:hypothetical protein
VIEQEAIDREAKRMAVQFPPTDWTEYRDALMNWFGVVADWRSEHWRTEAEVERGQRREGRPGDWFKTLRWSDQAWLALHGEKGPRR